MLRPALALLLALAAPLASAQDPTPPLTRADVRAELHRARAAGELEPRTQWLRGADRTKSTLTREEVQAELMAARGQGRLDVRDAVVNETLARHGR